MRAMSRIPAFCTVGSAAALVDIVSPIASRSTQGKMHQPQPGCGSPRSRIATIADHETSAGAIAGKRNAAGLISAGQQEAIGRDAVLGRGRKRMFGCKAVIEC